MKSVKKLVFATVALLMLAMIFFTACGNKNDGNGGTGGNDGNTTVKAESLQVRYDGGQDLYFVGDSVNLNRLVITATLDNGTKKTFVAGKESECKVEPSVFKAGDDKVTITYGGASVSFDVTVVSSALSEVTVNFGNVGTTYAHGTPVDLSGITVTAKYGTEYSFVVDDYKIVDKDSGTEYEPDEVNLSVGAHSNMCVRYKNVESSAFELYIFNGYIVEAENIKTTEQVTDADKNFVELIKSTGENSATTTGLCPGPISKAEEPASGGSYLGEVKTDAVFAFHIWSDVEREADIILRAASGLLEQDYNNSWAPIVMGDMQFNRLFNVTYSNSSVENQPIAIGDDVILEGGSTENPNGDWLLWVGWKDVVFGSVTLKPGDNVFTFTVTSDYKNCHNSSCAANVDRMEVRFKD